MSRVGSTRVPRLNASATDPEASSDLPPGDALAQQLADLLGSFLHHGRERYALHTCAVEMSYSDRTFENLIKSARVAFPRDKR